MDPAGGGWMQRIRVEGNDKKRSRDQSVVAENHQLGSVMSIQKQSFFDPPESRKFVTLKRKSESECRS